MCVCARACFEQVRGEVSSPLPPSALDPPFLTDPSKRHPPKFFFVFNGSLRQLRKGVRKNAAPDVHVRHAWGFYLLKTPSEGVA